MPPEARGGARAEAGTVAEGEPSKTCDGAESELIGARAGVAVEEPAETCADAAVSTGAVEEPPEACRVADAAHAEPAGSATIHNRAASANTAGAGAARARGRGTLYGEENVTRLFSL